MLQVSRGARLVALIAMVLLGIAGFAAEKPKPAEAAPAGIGVIELDAVTRQYKGWEKAQNLLGDYYNTHQGILDGLAEKGMGLSSEEFDEYQRLAGNTVKVNPARIAELEKKAAEVQGQYRELQTKEPKTDADKAKMAELEKTFGAVDTVLQKQRTEYDTKYNDMATQYSKALIAQLDKSLEAVAAAKKLSIIVSRDVQVPDPMSQRMRTEKFVIWGGTNVTDDVIKHLNDNFKDSLLAPAK